ncbi:hypothetical protein RIF29_11641 [Crotalaria pallida]|uniref:Uncharacterized protein n=1 Tax=Crotalaria pallida TaxID=3830 RepID=A0AAN9IMI2_CROPI
MIYPVTPLGSLQILPTIFCCVSLFLIHFTLLPVTVACFFDDAQKSEWKLHPLECEALSRLDEDKRKSVTPSIRLMVKLYIRRKLQNDKSLMELEHWSEALAYCKLTIHSNSCGPYTLIHWS